MLFAKPSLHFMILGFPRSGTTWAANLLTTSKTHCVHDPLYRWHYTDIDKELANIARSKTVGISCTGLWRWPEWVNAHPSRKVVLHRDTGGVRDSLSKKGLCGFEETDDSALWLINGEHYNYDDLFNVTLARDIWSYVTTEEFDEVRYAELVRSRVEPTPAAMTGDPELYNRLAFELA